MLSVLIPVYNYNIVDLVKEIHRQLQKGTLPFEIICLDDCSTQHFMDNFNINELPNTSFVVLGTNIGRSAIRNLLARKATFENLLFLDADTKIIKTDFIETYLTAITDDAQIIYGGINYQKESPSNDKLLRWVYGKKREELNVSQRKKSPHLRFLTLNFIIKKSLFNQVKFNEDIPNLRHEDTLFGLTAKKLNIDVIHINNPVLHMGLESSEVFLNKSLESCDALKLFIERGLMHKDYTTLSKTAHTIETFYLSRVVAAFYNYFKGWMCSNLLSKRPNMFIFDVYRLGYYCSLKVKD